jgi:methyl coenzyme M reductase gamma subunit
MAGVGSKDPQWDLVVEIAAKLWIDGVYVARLDPSPTQRYVDLQWAGRQAGRVLGGRAVVTIRDARGPEDSKVTVTVTFVDPDGRSLQRAEEGLENLLRKVLAEQSRGRS